MNKNKIIRKISFNMTAISSTLLTGFIITNNIERTKEVFPLVATLLISGTVYIKTLKNRK